MNMRTPLLSISCICLLSAGAYCLQPAEAPATAPAKEPNLVFRTGRPQRGTDLALGVINEFSRLPVAAKDANFIVQMRVTMAVMPDPNVLSDLAASAPDTDFASAEVRDLLRGKGKLGVSVSRQGAWSCEIELLFPARSEAQAQELSRGVAAFCQTWWEKRGHEYSVNRLGAMKKEALDANAAWAMARKQWAGDRAMLGLKDGDPLPATALDELVMKRMLLDADIAGAKAKVEAAGLVASREAIEKSAQVELADLKARREKLEAMIPSARRLLHNELSNAQNNTAHLECDCKSLEADLAAGRLPAPKVGSRGEVYLYPIDWTNAPAPGSGGPSRGRGARGAAFAPSFEAP